MGKNLIIWLTNGAKPLKMKSYKLYSYNVGGVYTIEERKI